MESLNTVYVGETKRANTKTLLQNNTLCSVHRMCSNGTFIEAQLEVPPALPNLHSDFSGLHASLTLLDPFDSVRRDPFGRLFCSCDLSQLPCCRGIGAFYVALSSVWPSVDSAFPNQTIEPNQLSPIRFRSHPNWLSPIRLLSSDP